MDKPAWQRRPLRRPLAILLAVMVVAALTLNAACAPKAAQTDAQKAAQTQGPKPTAYPRAGEGNVPASVKKLTVAVDDWFSNSMDPVDNTGPAFLLENIQPTLLKRNESHEIVPALAMEWKHTAAGLWIKLNPNAKWQDGTPITVEDIKWNFEAMRGDYAPNFKGHFAAARFKNDIKDIEIIDNQTIMIHTNGPIPDFLSFYGGMDYHAVWFGPAQHLQKVGHAAFEERPLGGGPYRVTEWKPGDRIVLERWDGFWATDSTYHKPQHEILEIILVPDAAARFSLLKSGQVDIAYNIPYSLAKDLPASDALGLRGVNPGKGEIWTQTITGTGNYHLHFVDIVRQREHGTPIRKPFDDIKVRQAMELALDKAAITKVAHFGFTQPAVGLWFTGAFGAQLGRPLTAYDPERARQLLRDAGFANGFEFDVYYGPFGNSPGQREWLEAAASYWQAVGIKARIFEVDGLEKISKNNFGDPPERKYGPLAVYTLGRQEHSTIIATYCCHAKGPYRAGWDDKTTALFGQLGSTMDPERQTSLLAEMEAYILDEQKWLIPMAEVSMVVGYSDRVLAHPTPPHAASFEYLWRIVTKD